MSVLITLFLTYVLIVAGLSITESVIKSIFKRASNRKHIKMKQPSFIKKQ